MKQLPPKDAPTKEHNGKLLRILILVLYFAVILAVLNPGPLSGTAIHRYEGTYGYAEDTWVFSHGSNVLEKELTTPAFRHMKTGDIYSITTELSYDGSRDDVPACFFFVDHMFCRALLDGEEMFRYMPEDIEKPDRSRSPGNVYVYFLLPQDCKGRELTIEFVPALSSDVEFQLPNPTFGDFATVAMKTFWSELPHNIISIFAMVLGVTSILFATLALPGAKYREGMLIGVFATLLGLYGLTESDFDFYAISNPYLTYRLDYLTFSGMPIALMAFMRERLDTRQRAAANCMIVIGIFIYAAEMILHFSGLVDMREYLPILHTVFFAEFLLIFILLITMKRNRWKKQLTLQMIPILFGMFMDAAVYYQHWQLATSDSTFTAIGVLIFLISELCQVWKYSIEVYMESIRSQSYREMAYVDALTGIGNRRAYDIEKNSLLDGQQKVKNVIVASVDVNNLKTTNDSFGHAAGDFLIRNAANVLSDLSEGCGHSFRIGGDEFIVFIYDLSSIDFEKRLDHMYQQIRNINGNSEIKLSLALGYEQCRVRELENAITLADRKMYTNKARIKGQPAREISEELY